MAQQGDCDDNSAVVITAQTNEDNANVEHTRTLNSHLDILT